MTFIFVHEFALTSDRFIVLFASRSVVIGQNDYFGIWFCNPPSIIITENLFGQVIMHSLVMLMKTLFLGHSWVAFSFSKIDQVSNLSHENEVYQQLNEYSFLYERFCPWPRFGKEATRQLRDGLLVLYIIIIVFCCCCSYSCYSRGRPNVAVYISRESGCCSPCCYSGWIFVVAEVWICFQRVHNNWYIICIRSES